MPVPTVITDLSATAASNFPAGTEAPNVLDDTLRAHGAFIRQLYDGPLIPAGGSAGAPAYSFLSDTNNGWFAPSADTQAWATAGVQRMQLDSTGLGLGNAAVYKITAYTGGAAASYVQAANGTTGVTSSDGTLFGVDASGNGVVNVQDALSLLLKTTGTTRGEANAAGYWGLNCTPVATVALRIQDPGNNDAGIEWLRTSATVITEQTYNRAGTSFVNKRYDALSHSLRVSGTEALAVDSSGNTIAKVNGSAPSLSVNSTMTFELTSNTSLRVFVRGSDGVTRSVTLTLA